MLRVAVGSFLDFLILVTDTIRVCIQSREHIHNYTVYSDSDKEKIICCMIVQI